MNIFHFALVSASSCLISSFALAAAGDFSSDEIANANFLEITTTLNCRAAPRADAPILFSFTRNDNINGYSEDGFGPMQSVVDAEGKTWVRKYFQSNNFIPQAFNCWARANNSYMRIVQNYGKQVRCETSRHIIEIVKTEASGAGEASTYHYYAWNKNAGSSSPNLYLTRFVDDNNPMPHASHMRIFEFTNGGFTYSIENIYPYAADPLDRQHISQSLRVVQGSGSNEVTIFNEACLSLK